MPFARSGPEWSVSQVGVPSRSVLGYIPASLPAACSVVPLSQAEVLQDNRLLPSFLRPRRSLRLSRSFHHLIWPCGRPLPTPPYDTSYRTDGRTGTSARLSPSHAASSEIPEANLCL